MSSNNMYFCATCGSQATKPPCARKVDPEKPLVPSMATLGTWSCPKCGKGVSVKRQRSSSAKEVVA